MENTESAAISPTHLSEQVRALAAPLAAGLGLDIWGIELAFSGRGLVRIYVESLDSAPLPPTDASSPDDGLLSGQGVSIDQCAELSRLLGLSLDVENVMPGAYTLEISSPGLDRVFFTEQQLARAVGQVVDLTLAKALDAVPGRRKYRGLLAEAPSQAGGAFSLLAEDCPKPGETMAVSFAFSDVKKVRQVYVPPDKTPPGKKKAAAGKKGQSA
jgi:ribosome maturation factor RimP